MSSKSRSRLGTVIQEDLFGSVASEPASAAKATRKVSRSEVESMTEDLLAILSEDEPRVPVPVAPKILSVTELSTAIRDQLQDSFPEIIVQGEICDFKGIHQSGHLYFALKDDKSQIRAVMWRMDVAKLPFQVKAGMEVIVTGRIDYYTKGGSLQIVATRMEPVGIGALQLKFEQLKEKLRAEGLFDASRKRKISPINWRIGIVTGRSTAALQDMLKIFSLRFPLAQIYLFHASVQGDRAPQEIIKAIDAANRYSARAEKPLDVLIVGRGGGSYEDLFCFNDELLARAIAGSKVPTVSAVGHEIDITIADGVADRRAATPSHAAQETVPEMILWLQRLDELEQVFERHAMNLLNDLRQKTDHLHTRILNAAPHKRLEAQRQILKDKEARLRTIMLNALERRKQGIARYSGLLDALSPLKVLDRGYAMAETPRGVARSVKDVRSGESLRVRFPDGYVKTQVLETEELG